MNAPALPLYPYQQRWFKDRSRFKLGRFARQTGKTFTTTLEIVDDTFVAEAERRRSPWVILSRGERQAKEAMEAAVTHAWTTATVTRRPGRRTWAWCNASWTTAN